MILFGLLLYVAAEIAALVVVAQQIGVLFAVLLVLLVSACGPFLLRRVGLGVLDHARVRLSQGESPSRDLLDGVVVVLGGVLVSIPGFVGDALGLLLLIRPVRHVVIRVAGRILARSLHHGTVVRLAQRPARNAPVIDAPTHPADPSDPADRGPRGEAGHPQHQR